MAFVTARDLAVAGAFYGDVLGLRRLASSPVADAYDASGAKLVVLRVDNPEPTEQTVFGWSVDDIHATIARLRDAGVKFIDYPGLTSEDDDVWHSESGARAAWFTDPEGHVLSVAQLPS